MCKQTENYIKINFMTEKRKKHGEDAPPLLVIKNKAIAVGVFDGMGGAGAATCSSKYGEDLSKAYVASRITEEEVESIFEESLGDEYISSDLLKERITQRLKKEQEMYTPKTKSMLRSKLVREYPTTMAVVTMRTDLPELQIDSYWAGDSHCYLWTRKGFFQISKDDLDEDNDPMENLHNDATISNCICADRDFHINHKQIILANEPVTILCATDGCFGYYPSPMHFEYVLKQCLQKAKNEDDWKNRLLQNIKMVAGDDTSLSLIGFGFESFSKFKNMMTSRPVKGIGKLRDLESQISSLKQRLVKIQEEYNQTMATAWSQYSQEYMKHINKTNDATAER